MDNGKLEKDYFVDLLCYVANCGEGGVIFSEGKRGGRRKEWRIDGLNAKGK